MTLIIGVNLVDRVYLVGDTRVTRDGVVVSEYQQKIVQINDQICAGFAGRVGVASFIVKTMKELATPTMGVDEFISVLESALAERIGFFLSETGRAYDQMGTKVLIAGINRSKYKTIENPGKIVPMVGEYYANSKRRVDEFLRGRTPESLSPEESSHLWRLTRYQRMKLKPSLASAILGVKDSSNELVVSNVYSALHSIDVPKGNPVPVFANHPWGSVVTAGASTNLEKQSNEFFMDIEMTMNSGDINHDLDLLLNKIRQHFGKTVGGCITPMLVSENGVISVYAKFWTTCEDGTMEPVFETRLESGKVIGVLPGALPQRLKILGEDDSAGDMGLML